MATLYNQYIYKNGAWMKIGTSSDSVTYALSYSALTGLLTLTGSDGSTSTVTIESGGSDAITGITVNGTTVTVTDGVAAISVPTTLSAFTNDVGYITSYTETDPTVPSWAKASTKPSYTAAEISINNYINWSTTQQAIDGIVEALDEIEESIPVVPTNVSAFTNDAGYITTPAFKITVTENNGVYTADKTYAEISQAINNGYICYITDGTYNYYYTLTIEGYFYFQHSTSSVDNYFYISSDSVLYSSENQFGTAAQNMVFATPPDQNGAPYFRALVASDIPDLSSVYSTTDEKVKQINTTSGTYSILLGNTYSAGTVTSSVNKAQLLSYNVSSNRLNVNNIQVGSVSQSGTIMLGGVALIGTGSSSGLVDNTVTLPAATGTVALAATTLAGYGITDAYTKTQIDGLVSGVLHYKGTKATTSALPSSGNTTGDVWHVTADGSEWAWDGSVWQELGTAIDLSGYVQTSTTINNKALTGNITLSASDVGALPSSTVITDQNVLQTPVNNNSTYGLTLSTNTWQAATDSVYTTDYVSFALDITNGIGQLRFRNSDDSAYTWIQNRALGFVDNNNQLEYTYTLPNKSGTVAMTSDIDGKWNGVTLANTGANINANSYVPVKDSTTLSGTASWATVTHTPSSYCIAKYDDGPYLYSTKPAASDNSTKVATTSFVKTALGALTADDISVSNSPLSFDYTGNTYTVTTAQDEFEALVTEIDSLADALDTAIPTTTSALTNDSGFITSSTTAKIFAQTSAPTSGMSAGDIWIDTSSLS